MPTKYWVKVGFGLYMGVFLGRVFTGAIAKLISKEENKKEETEDSRE